MLNICIFQPPNGVCLGDLCDILRCEVLDVMYQAKDPCNETHLSTLTSKCEVSIVCKVKCESLRCLNVCYYSVELTQLSSHTEIRLSLLNVLYC